MFVYQAFRNAFYFETRFKTRFILWNDRSISWKRNETPFLFRKPSFCFIVSFFLPFLLLEPAITYYYNKKKPAAAYNCRFPYLNQMVQQQAARCENTHEINIFGISTKFAVSRLQRTIFFLKFSHFHIYLINTFFNYF